MTANKRVNQLERGCSPFADAGGTCASPAPCKRLQGPEFAPADLLLFLRENPIGDVTRALGLAKGTVHRLRHGYWPADPRKILQAWGRHKASRSVVGTSWFMRRVRPGGLVRHAGLDFTAPRLAARTGAFLAVTRTAVAILPMISPATFTASDNRTMEMFGNARPIARWIFASSAGSATTVASQL